MADLQKKMNAHQQDIDQAKEQIHDTTEKADSYLTELTKSVEDYEKKHSNFEPAGQYLKSALDASRSATQQLKTRSQDLSERTVPVALDGMKEVRESFDELQSRAVEYDDKYAGSRGQEAMDTLHHWVNSGRQRATDALETTNDRLMKLRDAIGNMAGQAAHGAQVAVGEAARVAEVGDEKLGVSSKAGGVVQRVKDLDARLGVTSTAAMVDTKVTGGLGCKMAATTVDIVTESVNYISETLQHAKAAAEKSETAQSVEAKGAAAADAATAKKNEIQGTFNEAYDKGMEKAGMAKEKTEEKAGEMKEKAGEMKDTTAEKADQAKEGAKDKAGMAKDKAGEMKDMTAEKAGEAKEMAKDKAGMAKDKAGDMKDMAEDKAGQAKETAKDQAGSARDKAAETADQAKDKAGDMKEKTKETAEQTKDKAGDAKDMAEDKAGQAKETAKDQAGSAKDKAAETADQAKDKAGDMKDKTQAAAGQTKDKTEEKAGESKEQSKGFMGKAADKAKGIFSSSADTAKSMGTRTEAKATKPKEPTLTQEQTTTEKGVEALKQTRAKASEAAKTSAGTAHQEMHSEHAKPDTTEGQRETSGFKAAQKEAKRSSK